MILREKKGNEENSMSCLTILGSSRNQAKNVTQCFVKIRKASRHLSPCNCVISPEKKGNSDCLRFLS